MDITALLATTPTNLFIDGEFVPSDTNDTFPVINPSDGTRLARVASASEADARRAGADWANTPSRERSTILHRAFELILDHGEELAWLQSLELGRALPDSRAEVSYGAEFFRWFAEEAVRIRGDYRHNPTGTGRIVVTHQPVGPCLAITPLEFSPGHGHPQAGPGPGGRLHHDREARVENPTHHAVSCATPCARRGASRGGGRAADEERFERFRAVG